MVHHLGDKVLGGFCQKSLGLGIGIQRPGNAPLGIKGHHGGSGPVSVAAAQGSVIGSAVYNQILGQIEIVMVRVLLVVFKSQLFGVASHVGEGLT